MNSQILSVVVGIGQPRDAQIILNFHFISPDGIEWTSSYSYGQLCQLDNYVNECTSKLRHIAFPVISTSRQQRILEMITDDHAYANSAVSAKNMIEKMRTMLETWIHVLLMRMHSFPIATQEKLESFFCLPLGPVTEVSSTPIAMPAEKKSLMFGFLGFGKMEEEDTYSKVFQREAAAEVGQALLLRLSVARGPEGPYGQLEYLVSRILLF